MDKVLPEVMTPRELDILRAMVEGLTNAEIAHRLILSAGTVKWYVKQLYSKLAAHSRAEAIAKAIELGLATPLLTFQPTFATTTPGIKPLGEDGTSCPLINPLNWREFGINCVRRTIFAICENFVKELAQPKRIRINCLLSFSNYIVQFNLP